MRKCESCVRKFESTRSQPANDPLRFAHVLRLVQTCTHAQSSHPPDLSKGPSTWLQFIFFLFPPFFSISHPIPPVWHHPRCKVNNLNPLPSDITTDRVDFQGSSGASTKLPYIPYCLPLYLDWPSTWNGPCICSPTLSHDHLHSRLSLFVPT